MILNKKTLRDSLKSIEVYNIAEKNKIITALVLSCQFYKNAEKLFIFSSIKNEPDTKVIIENALASKKEVFLPKTKEEMRFYKIEKGESLSIGRYGIDEPSSSSKEGTNPDIIFIPMVAYDKNKGRLGHGKGYYDRFLENNNCLKVGMCFSDFLVNDVFCDLHDIKMDIIITDKGIIT